MTEQSPRSEQSRRGMHAGSDFKDNSAAYGLNYEARCMASRLGERECHQFIVGTHTLREKNEIHVIEYSEDSEQVDATGVYSHPGEIWQLEASSCDKDLFATAYTNQQGWNCSIWKLDENQQPPAEEGGGAPEESSQMIDQLAKLNHVVDLKGHEGPISTLRWSVLEEGEESAPEAIVTLDSKRIRWWPMSKGSSDVLLDEKSCLKTPEISGLTTGCFDPHKDMTFVAASHKDITCWDFRNTKKAGITVKNAHQGRVLDIDFNPNRPYHIVSAGTDMVAQFWDVRKASQPLKCLGGHTHWVCAARFNRFHDQLLLTSGTDTNVNLWSMVSVSSAPVGEHLLDGYDDEEEEEGEGGDEEAKRGGKGKTTESMSEKEGDKLIKRYESHRDSVYSIAWSSDAWVFASLSYDGTVIVNTVPQSEKYKILL